MFFDGVFDNMDGMTYIPVGQYTAVFRTHASWLTKSSSHGLVHGNADVWRPSICSTHCLLRITSPTSQRLNNGTSKARPPTFARYLSTISICVEFTLDAHLQGKLERTRPFYVPQFEALKKFTTPEVFSIYTSR